MTALARPALHRNFHRLAWFALIMTASTILFGAFVRLSDAGLSCPDWPTCYGKVTWPQTHAEAAEHPAIAIRPLETHKAWLEQVHRFLAAALGIEVLILALLAARRRARGAAQILGACALVAVAIGLYMSGQHVLASVLALAGEAILLLAAWRWSNTDLARAAVLTLAVIVFQAVLGMWTVTWLLKPIVVMGHLLGGLTTFALLTWIAWRATGIAIISGDARRLRVLLGVGLALLAVQIALGGWTSANYAALACGTDFPKCAGAWWPSHDFAEGFVLWRGIGVDYEGGILDNAARVAIQLAHRMMAVVVACYLLFMAVRLLRMPGLRGWGSTLALLVCIQFGLGIANVVLSLPLKIAVLHNAGAVALLFVLVTLLARLRLPEA